MKGLYKVLLGGLLLLSTISVPAYGQDSNGIRIGITPVFLNYQTTFLNDWKSYLSHKLNRPVEFIQRNTYREVTDLLINNEIDFAWICGYPYMRLRERLQLMAVPLYQGKPLYQSYLIVPRLDLDTRSISDLNGKIFVYSDPDSNSGYLVPKYQLALLDIEDSFFFRKTFFTWAHEKVVEAVASGIAHGGAVDGYVWDTLQQLQPSLTQKTRIVSKSELFGFPPLVARIGLSEGTFQGVQSVLLNMSQDPEGEALLKRLNIDGFIQGDDDLFEGIADMMKFLTRN